MASVEVGRAVLTTKLHLFCDGKGRPLAVVLTPGQRHDSTQLGPLLDAIQVSRPSGRGWPRKQPDRLIADKGYAYERCRKLLRRRGIAHPISERDNQRALRARCRAASPPSIRRRTGGATWSIAASTG